MYTKPDNLSQRAYQQTSSLFHFILGSTVGISIYFIPFTFAGRKTIFLDHLVTGITRFTPTFGAFFTLVLILFGSMLPFYEKSWNRNLSSVIMTCLKLLGAGLGVMAFFEWGPDWMLRPDMLPLLFHTIAVSVALIVPVGSFFLTFLTDYGLIGFLGVLLQPVMRPVWKLPGTAAVNVVASVIGSFSVGIFMADQLYKEGKFSRREGVVVITGFSTVSATFMVIIARNLDLIHLWNTFFWTAVLVTFLVTAILVRLYPLNTYSEQGQRNEPDLFSERNLLSVAFEKALIDVSTRKNMAESILYNVKEGITMSLRFLPLILSIGIIAFSMARMTIVFDLAAYFVYPVVFLLGLPDPLAVSKAIMTSGVDVIMPSLMMSGVEASLEARFTVGVVSVSSILFLAGTIPCILSTGFRISLVELFIIFMERLLLSLIIVSLVIKILF